EALESIEFGYKFAVHGELGCDQQELLNKLMDKTRKGIAKQQVETGVFPNGQIYNSIIHDQLPQFNTIFSRILAYSQDFITLRSEALESIEFGYKFAVHGELGCDQQELLNKLMDKTRKGIAKQQVETGVFPNGQIYNSIIHDQLPQFNTIFSRILAYSQDFITL